MKVTDLMVGDWVNVNGLNLKVGAIHADEIGVFDPDLKIYWCSDDGLDSIGPIPLTEEILVKNGFEYTMPYNDYAINEELSLYQCGDGFAISGFCNRYLRIDYVHQLQHLLRLAGIEKEIKL